MQCKQYQFLDMHYSNTMFLYICHGNTMSLDVNFTMVFKHTKTNIKKHVQMNKQNLKPNKTKQNQAKTKTNQTNKHKKTCLNEQTKLKPNEKK